MPSRKSQRPGRRRRRTLTMDELERLLEATAASPMVREMSGPDRRIFYLLALHTDLTHGEIASLTRASFQIDTSGGAEPTVTFEARHSAYRERRTIPMHPALASELHRGCTAARPSGPSWPSRRTRRGCSSPTGLPLACRPRRRRASWTSSRCGVRSRRCARRTETPRRTAGAPSRRTTRRRPRHFERN